MWLDLIASAFVHVAEKSYLKKIKIEGRAMEQLKHSKI